MIKINHNLERLVDVISIMPMEIQSAISSIMEENRQIIQDELIAMFGGGEGEVLVTNDFNGESIVMAVDGVNIYQMYYTTGLDVEGLRDFVETRSAELLQERLKGLVLGNGY